jgi:hypothetical protein
LNLIIVGTSAWLLTALLCYVFLGRTAYNVFDPLLLTNISVPFSAALLAVLCASELVPWEKLVLFTVALLGYLAGGRVAAAFYGRETFREVAISALSQARRGEIFTILTMTLCTTLVVAALGLMTGAAGDARQEFGRTFRPLVLLQNGLFWYSLVLLLSRKLSGKAAASWLVTLLLLSVPFSGKGVLLPALYWFGLRIYLYRKPITLFAMLSVASFGLAGAGAMTLLAYRASGISDAFLRLTTRFWMSGDVYLLAYQMDGLAAVRGNYPVSFPRYMMHPITALVGMRAYDKPLGGMLQSAIAQDNVMTGPNPQLPVVLDFFFPDRLALSIGIAFVIGFMVISIRPIGMLIAKNTRSRYFRIGGIAAAVFCPSAGFLDTSQVEIGLVSLVAVASILVGLELLLANQPLPISPTKVPT